MLVNDDKIQNNNEEKDENWQFENFYEVLLYTKHQKDYQGSISWVRGNDYINQMKRGYNFFEVGQFSKAMAEYQKAMEYNPVAIVARFEIAECMIRLGLLRQARQQLMSSVEYFNEASDAARFYRRLGYIAVDNHNYKLGMACYMVSSKYENTDMAKKEISYILSKKGVDFRVADPDKELKKAGIPIIEAYKLADRNEIPKLSTDA